uniref:MGH1-like glycoside hydrolase domain-containing protein n=1 Tax=Salipiger bermudensis TaxID=344736 RepID=UPI003519C4C1
WHRWWMQTRCDSGAVAVCHPWESGRANCPDWDVGLANVDGSGAGDYARRDAAQVDGEQRPTKLEYDRYLALVRFGKDCGWDQQTIVERCPFLMADPGITFLLIRAHGDLAALGRALGEDVSEIEGWAAQLRAGVQTLWNPELQSFDARDLRSGAWAGVIGSGALLCWLARCERPEMEAHLARMWDAVTYGLPSSDPEAPSFERKRYWRGPVWPQMNALIGLGLLSAGRDWDEARLREETAALIESAGFREYFDPLDAAPCGGDNFTWTAAVWLAWAGR